MHHKVILFFRGHEDHRGVLDLCVLVFRESTVPVRAFSTMIESSRRQLKSFVGCNVMLEPGEYVIMPLAFNHWSSFSSGKSSFSSGKPSFSTS